MLLWIIMIGGVAALALAFVAMRGPSASKALKRRIELVKERHGDIIAGSAQAQIRKLMAARASRSSSRILSTRMAGVPFGLLTGGVGPTRCTSG